MACTCETIAGGEVALSSTCIGHLWLFENLKAEELDALIDAAFRERFTERDRPIFSQGGPADRMFLIKAGRVKLTKWMEAGAEITLDIRKAGDFLGENVLSEDLDYPLTALCMEETLICGFTKERFEKLILEYPNIGLQVIKNLSKRISRLTSRLGSLSLASLEERLYGVLANVAQEHGIKSHRGWTIQFPLTHEDLSFLVGAHRVSITRAMKDLKRSGRIIQEGKALIVPSAEADSLKADSSKRIAQSSKQEGKVRSPAEKWKYRSS